MDKSFSVDWFRATIPFEDTTINLMKRIEQYFPAQEWREADKIMRPYISGKSCDYATAMWHDNHAEFGVMLELTGMSLSAYREAGNDVSALLEMLTRDGWKPTRIDLAIDVLNSGGRPSQIYRAWSKRRLETTARKVTIYQQTSTDAKVTGETVYIGARSSPRLLRVYDKAAERGTTGDWLRLELELKEGHAVAGTDAIINAGIQQAALSYLRSAVKTSSVPFMEQLFDDGETFAVEKLGRKKTEFERWFWKTIVPAIEKALRLGLPGAKEALQSILDNVEVTEHGP